jgi:hypothetical protein
MTETSNRSEELAKEYVRLGGKRRAVLDDNLVSTREWEDDSPEAATFWRTNIENLPANQKEDVEKFLPGINAI